MSTEAPPIAASIATGEYSTSQSNPVSLWLGGLAAAITIAWVGAKLNAAGSAPIGLLPIGIGAVLGLAIVGLAAIARVKCRTRLVAAAVALSIVTVFAEHAWLYRDYRQDWWQAPIREPRLALFRTETAPLSPAAYYAREIQYSPQRPLFWAADAGLLVAATLASVVVGRRWSG